MEHSLIFVLTIATIGSFIWLNFTKERLHMNTLQVAILAIAHTFIGVVCVMAFAVIESLDLNSFGSMSLFGGVFFMPIFYFIFSKVFKLDSAVVFDTLTPCMIFTLLCARFNCILSGCCTGRQIPGTSIHWPTRELEILFYTILLIYVIRKEMNIEKIGIIYPIYMTSYGVFRFIIEGFRVSGGTSLFHIAHIWAVISALLGWSIYVELSNNRKGKKNYV